MTKMPIDPEVMSLTLQQKWSLVQVVQSDVDEYGKGREKCQYGFISPSE